MKNFGFFPLQEEKQCDAYNNFYFIIFNFIYKIAIKLNNVCG